MVLHSRAVFSLPPRFSFTKQRRPLLSVKDVTLAYGSAKDYVVHSSVSITNSDRRDRALSEKEADSKKHEEILALLRRIRSSISREETASIQKSKADLSNESNNQIKDVVVKKEEKRVITRKQPVPKKEKKLQQDGQSSALGFRASRLPSNFSKRSPIPSPTLPSGYPDEVNCEASKVSSYSELKDMKLTKLKELAKAQGIKGYSKLKKSELLELLSS